MRGIHQHYESVAIELAPPEDLSITLPASNRSIVLVSKLHLPTLRALAYARATRPSHLEAVTVDVDEAETLKLKEDWERSNIPVPLTVVASPYREITRPIVGYVKRLRRESPRDIVTLYIPEYVLGHWWEQLLHNQSALRLKTRLLQMRGVVVASVPYQLSSATRQQEAAKSQLEAAKGQHGPPTPAALPGARPAAGVPGGTSPDGDSPPSPVPPSPAQPNGSKDGPAAAAPAGPPPRFKPLSALRRLTAARDQLHAEELQE